MNNKHFIPVFLLAATLVMAGCNEREIATSSTSKTGLSTSDQTSLSTSGAESVESLTSASVESKDSQHVDPSSEVSNSSNPTSADTGSQDSASSQSTQEVVPVYVDWYVVGQGAFLNGGPSWGDGGVRMQEIEEALGVAHVTFSVGDKFKVSDKAASNAKWLGHDVLDKGTAYVDPDGDGNMVLNQAGTYDVVLTNEEHIKLLATGNTPVKEDPVPEALTHDYYVIGNMDDSNWGANKEKYGMDKITSDDKADYYRSDALELAANVELKVVDQEKHNDKWFPTNNITIADAGTYYVYYLPSHDGVGDVWHDGCVAVTLATAEAPAIPSKSVEPPVTHTFAIAVDGVALELQPSDLSDPEANDNDAAYKDVALEANQKVKITDNGTELHFWKWIANEEEENGGHNEDLGVEYNAAVKGTYTFWVNKDGKVWVDVHPEPAISYTYYLVGAFNNYNLDGAPMFSAMGEESKVDGHTQYMASEVTLALDFSVGATNDFKVTGVPGSGQAHVHFPEEGSGHTLTQAGKYNVYFVPEGNSAWAETYFYFEKLSDGEPQNALKVLVNGKEYAAENIVAEDDAQNVAIYEFVAAEGTYVTFTRDGNPMGIHHGEAAAVNTFQLPQNAKYTFYVNNSYEVYVVISPIMYMAIFDDSDRFEYVYANPANSAEGMYTVELEKDEALNFWTLDYEEVKSDSLDPASPADIRADLALEFFVANQAGTYTFYVKTVDDEFSVYVTGPAKPVETPVTEYYLIGGNAEDGWTTLKEANKLSAMDDESKLDGHVQYHLDNVHLDQYAQYKVVGVTEGEENWTWYPPSDDNGDNNYFIQTGGTYNVYFVAEGGHEAWSTGKGYMYCHLVEADAPSVTTYTDTITRELTGSTGSSYADWSGKTSNSGVVYAGQSAGGNNAIQLRTKNSNSGIVVTGNSAGLKAKKVIITFNSSTTVNNKVDIYASNTAYTSPTELYGSAEALGSVAYNGSAVTYEFEITGDYLYIGLRSNNNAIYLDSVQIVWAA